MSVNPPWSCVQDIKRKKWCKALGKALSTFHQVQKLTSSANPYSTPEMDKENMTNNNSAPLLCHVKPPHKALSCL